MVFTTGVFTYQGFNEAHRRECTLSTFILLLRTFTVDVRRYWILHPFSFLLTQRPKRTLSLCHSPASDIDVSITKHSASNVDVRSFHSFIVYSRCSIYSSSSASGSTSSSARGYNWDMVVVMVVVMDDVVVVMVLDVERAFNSVAMWWKCQKMSVQGHTQSS